MTVEAEIVSLLGGLVGNRVYADVAPPGATLPYIVYQQVGGQALSYVDNALPDKENGRFQFAVWDNSRIAAKALIKQIESALVTASVFQARPIGAPISRYEEDTKLYGSQQDFSIWSDR